MKRPRLRTLLLLLLLGAAVNVAVAWGCAARSTEVLTFRNPSFFDVTEPNSCYYALCSLHFGNLRVRQDVGADHSGFWETRAPWVGPDWLFERLPGASHFREPLESRFDLSIRPRIQGMAFEEHWSGWPMLSFRGWKRTDRLQGMTEQVDPTGLIRLGERTLPLIPTWPSFAINTVFYAVVCWLLSLVPWNLRKHRRRRRVERGLCPACAYPVGASDVCTECGKPVVPRSVEPLA